MGRLEHWMIGAAVLALTACGETAVGPPAPFETESVAAPIEDLPPLTVDILDCGTIVVSDLDVFSSDGDYAGVSDTMTDPCFLIHHPDGKMIWDLGLPSLLSVAGPQTQQVFTVSMETTITSQLADQGLTTSDIDVFAVSHSHFDHIGQVDQLQDSLWLVHEDELAAMLPADGEAPDVTADQLALFALFEGIERKTFTGDFDVFGDGRVVIFETPGHTPGHTALQLNMPEAGYVLLTGDLYHRAESRGLRRVPRFNFDEAQTRESFEAFEARAESLGAKIIIQHEPADIDPLNGEIR